MKIFFLLSILLLALPFGFSQDAVDDYDPSSGERALPTKSYYLENEMYLFLSNEKSRLKPLVFLYESEFSHVVFPPFGFVAQGSNHPKCCGISMIFSHFDEKGELFSYNFAAFPFTGTFGKIEEKRKLMYVGSSMDFVSKIFLYDGISLKTSIEDAKNLVFDSSLVP